MNTTTTIENRTFKGLRAVEEEGYNSVKQWIDEVVRTKTLMSTKLINGYIEMFRGISDEDAAKQAASENITVAQLRAKHMGVIRALNEALNTYANYFDACDKEYRAKEEQDEIAKRKAEQEKREANREKNPIFYIGNGGGTDCFDYYGWDTNKNELVKVFVDWDSGRGNEMMPSWEDNNIGEMPDSCIEAFKQFSAEYFSHKVGSPRMFFYELDCKVSIPCKVTTGRKSRGEGTLIGYKTKKFRDYTGYVHENRTALIIDKDGKQQEAVWERVEISDETEQDIVKRGIHNMTVKQIADIYGIYLWHFGRDSDMAYPKIIRAAFKELNEED